MLEQPNVTCATFGSALLVNWRGKISMQMVDDAVDVQIAFGKGGGGRFIQVGLIEEGVPIPDGKVSQRFSRALRQLEPYLRAIVVVYEGGGIGSTAVRAASRAMLSLSRAVVPIVMTATVDEGTAWLVRRGYLPAADEQVLREGIAAVRARR